ncbi:MAG: hypothetical protein ACM30G_17680 [Micromonosporaceae bacterium]
MLPLTIGLLVLGLVAIGAGVTFLPGSPLASGSRLNGGAEPTTPAVTTPPPPPPLPFRAAEVTVAAVNTKGFLSWALMDLRSGEIWGSPNMTSTTTTMSLIKAWLAADYLRTHPQPTSGKLKDLELMIRDSNNASAERIYVANGTRASVTRAIAMCGLTETRPAPSGKGFGYTIVSAQDAVRIAACIADGRAAGTGTERLLGWMRTIRLGNFGPAKALPVTEQASVALKNGWDIWHEDKTYRTNCMAFGETWAMAVMLQYPSSGSDDNDLAHNSQVCKDVATLLRNPEVP